MQSYEEPPVIFVRDLLHTVWRRAWVVLLSAILVGAAATGVSLFQQPRYEASTMLLVSQERENVDSYNLQGDVMGLQQLTQTMATAVGTPPVAREVIQQTELEISSQELIEDRLEVEQVTNTQFIDITYQDSDPETARRVANAFGEVFSEQAAELSPDNGGVTITLWSQAELPNTPISPQPVLYGALGLAVGVMLGLVAAFVLEFLAKGRTSTEEAESAASPESLDFKVSKKILVKNGEVERNP